MSLASIHSNLINQSLAQVLLHSSTWRLLFYNLWATAQQPHLRTAQKRSVRAVGATAQQPHLRTAQKRSLLAVWATAQQPHLCTAQKRSVRAVWATAQQPDSRAIFLRQKILTLGKLINHQEGIFAYKEINGTYLLNDILTDRLDLHHYQLINDENLRIPLHITTLHITNSTASIYQNFE